MDQTPARAARRSACWGWLQAVQSCGWMPVSCCRSSCQSGPSKPGPASGCRRAVCYRPSTACGTADRIERPRRGAAKTRCQSIRQVERKVSTCQSWDVQGYAASTPGMAVSRPGGPPCPLASCVILPPGESSAPLGCATLSQGFCAIDTPYLHHSSTRGASSPPGTCIIQAPASNHPRGECASFNQGA